MNLLNNIIETPFGLFRMIFPDKRDPKSRKYYYTYQEKPTVKIGGDWREFVTHPPFNQGNLGSCVRCAIAGGMEMTYRRAGIEINFAEQQYKWDEETDPNKGQGMTPEHGLRETLRIGQSEARFWEPYRDQFNNMAHELPGARENAELHRIKSFHRITKIDDFPGAVARKDGFVTASIWIDTQWFNPNVQMIEYTKSPKLFLHQIYFCKDDILVNSWGPWGIGFTGKAWIRPEAIEKRVQDMHFVKVF